MFRWAKTSHTPSRPRSPACSKQKNHKKNKQKKPEKASATENNIENNSRNTSNRGRGRQSRGCCGSRGGPPGEALTVQDLTNHPRVSQPPIVLISVIPKKLRDYRNSTAATVRRLCAKFFRKAARPTRRLQAATRTANQLRRLQNEAALARQGPSPPSP